MKQIDTTNARIIRMNNKSVTFELTDGTIAFANKRVANEILTNKDVPVFLIEKEYSFGTNLWLATPSIF